MKRPSKAYYINTDGTYVIKTGHAILTGYWVGVDAATDVDVTIYNATSALDGNQVIPTTPHDAAKQQPMGFVDFPIECPIGLTVVVATIGTGGVEVFWHD